MDIGETVDMHMVVPGHRDKTEVDETLACWTHLHSSGKLQFWVPFNEIVYRDGLLLLSPSRMDSTFGPIVFLLTA